MGDKLGTIQTGQLADLLVVAGNPLDDIQNLRNMKVVVADGRVVRNRLARAASTGTQVRVR